VRYEIELSSLYDPFFPFIPFQVVFVSIFSTLPKIPQVNPMENNEKPKAAEDVQAAKATAGGMAARGTAFVFLPKGTLARISQEQADAASIKP